MRWWLEGGQEGGWLQASQGGGRGDICNREMLSTMRKNCQTSLIMSLKLLIAHSENQIGDVIWHPVSLFVLYTNTCHHHCNIFAVIIVRHPNLSLLPKPTDNPLGIPCYSLCLFWRLSGKSQLADAWALPGKFEQLNNGNRLVLRSPLHYEVYQKKPRTLQSESTGKLSLAAFDYLELF